MATAGEWVQGARPRTLGVAVAPVLVGTAAATFGEGIHWWRALGALVVSLAIQVGVNYANDYSDGVRGTDEVRRGPIRLTASNLATPAAVKRAAIVSFAVAGVVGAWLSLVVDPWLLLLGAFCIVAAVGYTGGPKPYGYLGLGELMVLACFGFAATAGSAYVQTHHVNATTWVGCLVVGLPAVAILLCNNIRDIPTDRVAGKRTLAVRIGDRPARALYALVDGGLARRGHRDRRALPVGARRAGGDSACSAARAHRVARGRPAVARAGAGGDGGVSARGVVAARGRSGEVVKQGRELGRPHERHRVPARESRPARAGDACSHGVAELRVLHVGVAAHHQHRHRQLAEAIPHRGHRSGAERAQCVRQRRGSCRGAVVHAWGVGGDVGEHGLGEPAHEERRGAVTLDRARDLLVSLEPRAALSAVGETGRRAHEYERVHEVRMCECERQREPAAHRVAAPHAGAAGLGQRVDRGCKGIALGHRQRHGVEIVEVVEVCRGVEARTPSQLDGVCVKPGTSSNRIR